MGETLHEIPASLIDWILRQHIFWVASAPLNGDGHINISPKGVEGTFHVLNSRKVWYEDLSGSGVETIAHLRENGRITVLLNAFDGPPRIVRLYGRGTVYEIGTPEYDKLLPEGTRKPGSRAVIVIDVFKVGTTCGYSVPYYNFVSHRNQLLDWAARKEGFDKAEGPACEYGMKQWWKDRNATSLDGLQGLTTALETSSNSGPRHLMTTPPPKNEVFRPRLPLPPLVPIKMYTLLDFSHISVFVLGMLISALYFHLLSSTHLLIPA